MPGRLGSWGRIGHVPVEEFNALSSKVDDLVLMMKGMMAKPARKSSKKEWDNATPTIDLATVPATAATGGKKAGREQNGW